MKSVRGAGLALACALVAASILPPAHAGPSMWERAAHPPARGPLVELRSEDVHRRVLELERQAALETDKSGAAPMLGEGMAQGMLQSARMLLLRHHARVAADVRLVFDLGRVLSKLGDDRYLDDAIDAYRSALLRAPDHPFATAAYFELGICYAKRGDHGLEELAYLAYLARDEDKSGRAIALGNLAESRMAQGKLVLAEEADRAAIAIDGDFFEARSSLAVILDRQGDLGGALAEENLVLAYDPGLAHLYSPHVFFSPDYDRHWYLALAHLAKADAIAKLDAPTSADTRAVLDRLDGSGGKKAVREGKPDPRFREMAAALLSYREWRDASSSGDRYRPIADERIRQLEAWMGLAPKTAKSK